MFVARDLHFSAFIHKVTEYYSINLVNIYNYDQLQSNHEIIIIIYIYADIIIMNLCSICACTRLN